MMLVRGELTERVIGLAVEVHEQLGPGLLESVYEECLAFELAGAGLSFQRQLAIPIVYRDTVLEAGFRADIVIADELIVEIKSIEAIQRVHEAQLLTYLRLSKRKVGLLMNFNVLRLKDGLRRFVM
jgi:GxxExxY protein